VIPKTVDEYYQHLSGWQRQDEKQRANNPVWHIHNGTPPDENPPLTFALLLNLVSAANASEANPGLDKLTHYAVAYYEDFVKPNKAYRNPTDQERAALTDLVKRFKAVPDTEKSDGEALQTPY